MTGDASYDCAFCGEQIAVSVDVSAGHEQEFVEDCPVCCRPHVIRASVDEDGQVTLHAQAESE